jgi:glycosyltransferase involved in cell wall biosynthesis
VKKLISIVTSAFNEQENVTELARQLRAVFQENRGYDFEVIMVENGSTDGTYESMLKVREEDPRFKIVQLSRNFRFDGGITAGLKYAKGDAAVVMTANLQDKPSLITEFIKKWEEGYENVYGIVKKRTGKGFLRRLNSRLFYATINRMTGDLIPKNVSDFRLIDRKVYGTLNAMPERNRFIRGMFAWTGFRSIGVEYKRAQRFSGKSHARSLHVLQLAIQGIFAFSYVPIRAISLFGMLISFASLAYLIFTVIYVFLHGVPFAGYGTIVSLIVLMFGILFFILGILGEYIAQIYEEVKQRPNYVVSEEVGFDTADDAADNHIGQAR